MTAPPDLSEFRPFWDQHEILAEIRDMAESRMVVPWALLGVTMARVLSAVPPHIQLPPIIGGPASLNFFVALTGPSGSSKSTTIECSYSYTDVPDEAQRENLGSGEGLSMAFLEPQGRGQARRLVRNQTLGVVYDVDEITTLGELRNRDGSTIGSVLRSAWSGRQLGAKNSDPMRDRRVPGGSYRLCLIAGVQPRKSSILLDDDGAGTPQRFVWVPTVDPEMPDNDSTELAPMISLTQPRWGGSDWEMPTCEEAWALVRHAYRSRQRGEEADGLNGHLLLCRLKVAAALAILCDRTRTISCEWWEQAGVVMEVSNRTREWAAAGAYEEKRGRARDEGVSAGVKAAASAETRDVEIMTDLALKFVAAIRETEHGTMTRRELMKKAPPSSREQRFPHQIQKFDADGHQVIEMIRKSYAELVIDKLLEERKIEITASARKNSIAFKLVEEGK